MSQKSSVPQAISFVSQVLKRDKRRRRRAVPVPTTQSPTSAFLRIPGLQVASVQMLKKGLGAKP